MRSLSLVDLSVFRMVSKCVAWVVMPTLSIFGLNASVTPERVKAERDAQTSIYFLVLFSQLGGIISPSLIQALIR